MRDQDKNLYRLRQSEAETLGHVAKVAFAEIKSNKGVVQLLTEKEWMKKIIRIKEENKTKKEFFKNRNNNNRVTIIKYKCSNSNRNVRI